jgi:hypothetical protein
MYLLIPIPKANGIAIPLKIVFELQKDEQSKNRCKEE